MPEKSILPHPQSGIINAIGTEIIILILFDFMKKDNIKNTAAKTGISTISARNKNESYNNPITVGITATNPNMRIFCLLSMFILKI